MALAIGRSGIRTSTRVGVSRGGLSTKSGVATTVKIFGVPEALAKFARVGQVAYRDTGLIVFKAAKRTEQLAKEKVPVVTGNLRDGIEAKKVGVYDWRVEASSRAGGSDREYSRYVEYGTRYMSARPYMRPAASEAGREMGAELTALAMKLERL